MVEGKFRAYIQANGKMEKVKIEKAMYKSQETFIYLQWMVWIAEQ
jgi:hypothetical protein